MFDSTFAGRRRRRLVGGGRMVRASDRLAPKAVSRRLICATVRTSIIILIITLFVIHVIQLVLVVLEPTATNRTVIGIDSVAPAICHIEIVMITIFILILIQFVLFILFSRVVLALLLVPAIRIP